VASQYGVNRAAAVCAMFLISHDKVTVPNALRAVQAAMDARGRHGLKPKMRTLANAAMARIVANMVHGNDYGIVHGASFAASSALLIDPPCPPIPLAVKPGPTAHQAAFLKWVPMLTVSCIPFPIPSTLTCTRACLSQAGLLAQGFQASVLMAGHW
jgi:hypothetical protein